MSPAEQTPFTIATFVVASLAGCALLYDRSGAPRTWGRR